MLLVQQLAEDGWSWSDTFSEKETDPRTSRPHRRRRTKRTSFQHQNRHM